MISEVTPTTQAVSTGFGRTTGRMAAARAAQPTLQTLGRRLDPHDPAVIQQAAGQLASELFFAPLLAEMRQFPFGQKLANGGQMEAAFGEQLDQRLADQVAASDQALLKQIVRQLAPQTETATPGAERVTWPAQRQTERAAMRSTS